jgi:osomolarity two-component system sensor histidine kinase NIK1
MNFDDKLTILLVEDNDLNQRLMKISLTRYHYNVTVAVNGLEGVQMFKNQKFDLILMDIMMPVMDGFEATNEIRKLESADSSLGHTPIIAFTANTINNDREKCVKGGMDDILEKPFDINKFREILSSLP